MSPVDLNDDNRESWQRSKKSAIIWLLSGVSKYFRFGLGLPYYAKDSVCVWVEFLFKKPGRMKILESNPGRSGFSSFFKHLSNWKRRLWLGVRGISK